MCLVYSGHLLSQNGQFWGAPTGTNQVHRLLFEDATMVIRFDKAKSLFILDVFQAKSLKTDIKKRERYTFILCYGQAFNLQSPSENNEDGMNPCSQKILWKDPTDFKQQTGFQEYSFKLETGLLD